ncbi:MAG TPA: MXAN_5808 family serine peptidase [Myxococcaceae bacterium]|nr:MXAN_5808 family serine peptidase [Myxococcaceae bacterium]
MTSKLRPFRRLAIVATLLGAWAVIASDRVPLTLHAEELEGEPVYLAQRDVGGSGAAQAAGEHELSHLRVLTKVILYVRDNYVDPNRIQPKEMMFAALDYVEKTAAEVLVEGTPEGGTMSVNVNGKVREFDVRHVDSLWKMSFMLKDVFEHVAAHLRPTEKTRDIEYAAVNGMLSTLDPHSILLKPELFQEMQLSTKGEFGGLGFMIQMREGNLTVVRVFPKTPAAKGGIRKEDVITRIGEESTVNMDLNYAVQKMRGVPGTPITLTVRRGERPAKDLTLKRDIITIESVQSKMLDQRVGYIRLKNFQGNTTRDMQKALSQLQRDAGKQGLQGLVLDLRGNPGGLLDQAIRVSDLLLEQGTIVATVGGGAGMRDEKKATKRADDLQLPLAVLVNSGSASASEIVAGAVKNLDRGVVIGRQTFGKGSVQVLYDFPDDSALKLTIAQYLTPGDKSIQEVGIMPDIVLTPSQVTKERVIAFAPRKSVGEADLDKHFGNPDSDTVAGKREEVLNREVPFAEVLYLKEDEKTRDVVAAKPEDAKRHGEGDPVLDLDAAAAADMLDDQLDAEAQDEIKEDFEVLFARDFVLETRALDRKQMLSKGKPFIERAQKAQAERINKAVAALDVDWKAGKRPEAPSLSATLSPTVDQPQTAGELLELKATVTNTGKAPLARVRGWTQSDNPWLDRREFLFGTLAPGESRTWTVPIKLPRDISSRRDTVTLTLHDDQGALPARVEGEVSFNELPRPAFAYTLQTFDACEACNGDGQVQKGELVEILLDVTNTGKGKALATYAQIKNGGDPTLFIHKGRYQIGEIAPGETKTARFQLQLQPGFNGKTYPVELAIVDEPLEEFLIAKLDLPAASSAPEVKALTGNVSLEKGTALLTAPAKDAERFGTLQQKAVVPREAAINGFVRVKLSRDRFAFVAEQDAKATRAKARPAEQIAYEARRAPPHIALSTDAIKGPVVSESERFTLTGTVTSERGLMDTYVLVNDQKVYFKAVEPDGKEPRKLRIQTEFSLDEGNNTVLVVGRESTDFANRKSLVIRRTPSALAAKDAAAGGGKRQSGQRNAPIR